MWGVTLRRQPTCCGASYGDPAGGLALTWLFVLLLGMIWAAILIPSRRRRRSPRSSVEEFEKKMNSLAETQNSSPGRWVVMPRKGQRIMDPGERKRFRARRRRRFVFMTLLELTVLALVVA